jgi:segregation and condensation protein A
MPDDPDALIAGTTPADGTLPAEASSEGSLDLGYTVTTDAFSGPLDLLLFLVRRTEVDVIEIPLDTVIDQFVATVQAWQDMDLEVAGDFIAMAATLLEIKARLVAPPPETEATALDDDNDLFDPRADLIRQLLAYRRFKEAAQVLGELEVAAFGRCARRYREVIPDDPEDTPDLELGEVDAHLLMRTCETIFARISGLGPRTVPLDDVPLTQRIAEVQDILREAKRSTLIDLMARETALPARLGLMLATLECTRQRYLEIRQLEQYGNVDVRWREDEERTKPPELPPEEPQPTGRRRRKPPLVTYIAPPRPEGEVDEAEVREEDDGPQETDEQRFLREINDQCQVDRLLTVAQDVEKSFLDHWYEQHPELRPPPPPEAAATPTPEPVPAPTPTEAPVTKKPRPARSESRPTEAATTTADAPATAATTATEAVALAPAVIPEIIPTVAESEPTSANTPSDTTQADTTATLVTAEVQPAAIHDQTITATIANNAALVEAAPTIPDAIGPAPTDVIQTPDATPSADRASEMAGAAAIAEPSAVQAEPTIAPTAADPTPSASASATTDTTVPTTLDIELVTTPATAPLPVAATESENTAEIPAQLAPEPTAEIATPETDRADTATLSVESPLAPMSPDAEPVASAPAATRDDHPGDETLPGSPLLSAEAPASAPTDDLPDAASAPSDASTTALVTESVAPIATDTALLPASTTDPTLATAAAAESAITEPEIAEPLVPDNAAEVQSSEESSPVSAIIPDQDADRARHSEPERSPIDDEEEEDPEAELRRLLGGDEDEDAQDSRRARQAELDEVNAALLADNTPVRRYVETAEDGGTGLSATDYLAQLDVRNTPRPSSERAPATPVALVAPTAPSPDPSAPNNTEAESESDTDTHAHANVSPISTDTAPVEIVAKHPDSFASPVPHDGQQVRPVDNIPADTTSSIGGDDAPACEENADIDALTHAVPNDVTATASPDESNEATAVESADVQLAEPSSSDLRPDTETVVDTTPIACDEATPVDADAANTRVDAVDTTSVACDTIRDEATSVEADAGSACLNAVASSDDATTTDAITTMDTGVINDTATDAIAIPTRADMEQSSCARTEDEPPAAAHDDITAALPIAATSETAETAIPSDTVTSASGDDASIAISTTSDTTLALTVSSEDEATSIAAPPDASTEESPATFPDLPLAIHSENNPLTPDVAAALTVDLNAPSDSTRPAVQVPPAPQPAALASTRLLILPDDDSSDSGRLATSPRESAMLQAAARLRSGESGVLKSVSSRRPPVDLDETPVAGVAILQDPTPATAHRTVLTDTAPPDTPPPDAPPTADASDHATPSETPCETDDDMAARAQLRIWRIATVAAALGAAALWWWTAVPRNVLDVVETPPAVIDGGSPLAWRFNLDVLAPDRNATRLPQPSLTPACPGAWTWRDRRTLVFTPSAPMPAATTFTVHLPEGLRSADGFRLPAVADTVLHTPALSLDHADVETLTSEGTVVALTFSHPVDPARLATALSALRSGTPIEITVLDQTPATRLRVRLPGEGLATLHLPAGFTGTVGSQAAVGSLGLEQPWTQDVVLGHRLRAAAASAVMPGRGPGIIRIAASSSDGAMGDLSLLAQAAHSDGPEPVRVVVRDGVVELIGDFPPGGERRIIVDARWPDSTGKHPLASYPAAAAFTVAIPHRQPTLWLGSEATPGIIGLSGINTAAQAVDVLPAGTSDDALRTRPLTSPTAASDTPWNAKLDAADLLRGLPGGRYRIRVRSADTDATISVDKLVVPADRILAAWREWQDAQAVTPGAAESGLRICVVGER